MCSQFKNCARLKITLDCAYFRRLYLSHCRDESWNISRINDHVHLFVIESLRGPVSAYPMDLSLARLCSARTLLKELMFKLRHILSGCSIKIFSNLLNTQKIISYVAPHGTSPQFSLKPTQSSYDSVADGSNSSLRSFFISILLDIVGGRFSSDYLPRPIP